MKIVSIVLDDETLRTADREARHAKVTRSELFRRALRFYAAVQHERALEAKHRAAYRRHPVEPGEFDVWDRVRRRLS